MRVGAELLHDLDRDVDPRQLAGANAASSNASGRMPSTTRAAPRGRRRAGSSGTRYCPNTDVAAVDRRLDEVHRRRADEGGDEEVARVRVEPLRLVDLDDPRRRA